MRIGLCTGGGDCPGLNAAIRAVVKHAIGSYGHQVFGIRDSFNGLMTRPIEASELHLADVSGILTRGGTVLGTVNYGNPFLSENDKMKRVVDAYKELKLDCIIVIGGDGTQDISAQFVKAGLNIVGIPKTIDNDLAATEISIGFLTSIDTATDAISKLRTTAESHDRIMVLELMGRDAGHIALHAGIAGGADAILIPEIPFTFDSLIKKVEHLKKQGRHYSIVVVAEGAFEKGQTATYKTVKTSTFATEHLGGIGAIVAERLHELMNVETRITVLGHVQRGGCPNAYDRILASQFGVYAVDLAHSKTFGVVAGINNGRLTAMPYKDIQGKTRPLDLDSSYIRTAEALGICIGR